MRTRYHRTICALAIASGVAMVHGQAPAPRVRTVMQSLAAAFRQIEGAAASGDASQLASAAASVAQMAAAVDEWRPAEVGDSARTFDLQAKALATLGSELHKASAKQLASRMPSVVEDTRQLCVSCHARFRESRPVQPFPARRNTVYGEVTVQRVNGGARDDRANVVVFLEGAGLDGRAVSSTATRVSQRHARFAPDVVPLVKGSSVHFPNDDTVFHNVFSMSAARPFDLGIYGAGQSHTVTFPRTGLVRVYCNLHPDMVMNVLVLTNGYFGVTDATGAYAIANVPDGDYRLRTWHRFGGETEQRVVLAGGVAQRHGLEVVESRRTLDHLNKFGMPYSGKY